MAYIPRTEQEAQIRAEMVRYAKIAARREKTKAGLVKKIMNDNMWHLLAGSEGAGLIGETIPITPIDWKLLQQVEMVVQAVKKRLSPMELEPYERLLKVMYADIYARSHTIESIPPLIPGEFVRRKAVGSLRAGHAHEPAEE